MPEACWGPVCEWIHVLSQWLKIHLLPFAPLITPIVATAAGAIAIYSIHVTRSVARKRGAVDFFLETGMDKGMVDAYAAFQVALSAWEKHDASGKPVEFFLREENGAYTAYYKDITSYLNIYELVAVGIKNKVFDHEVCYNFWSDALVRHTDKTRKLIEHEVASEGGLAAYLELRKLSIEWKRRLQSGKRNRGKKLRSKGLLPKPVPAAGQNLARPSQETIVANPLPPITPDSPPVTYAETPQQNSRHEADSTRQW